MPLKASEGAVDDARVTVLELTRSVQVGRQAIYDRDRDVVAYGMRFRPTRTGADGARDHEEATSRVMSTVFGDFGVADIADTRPLFVNVTRPFLVGELPLPASPEQVVVEVVGDVRLDAEVLDGVARLRTQGYRVAAGDWAGEGGRDALLGLSDVVKVNLARTPLDRLPGLVERARALSPAARVAVERTEDAEAFRCAHSLGVDMFQGVHLQRPQLIHAPQLAPSEIMCLKLLGALNADELSMREIEAVVSGDPGLAVRVLRTASSAAAAGRPVSSLRQALALIGPKLLSSWVVLMLVGGSGRVPHDQMVTMLARAGACGTIAGGEPHVAFTTGLLSGVSEILGVSALDTVRTTGIGPEVADALLGGEGEAGTALRAVLAYERDDPQAVVSYGFTPYDVSRAYLEAVRAANAVANDVAA